MKKRLDAEVAELQSRLSGGNETPQDSIESMTSGMQAVLADMKQSGRVAPELVQQAEGAMTKLVSEVRAVAARAAAAENAASPPRSPKHGLRRSASESDLTEGAQSSPTSQPLPPHRRLSAKVESCRTSYGDATKPKEEPVAMDDEKL